MSLTLEYFYQKTRQNIQLRFINMIPLALNKKITWVYLLDDVT